ncbi:hypothetical protein EBU71_14795 [bacterium]|nr:hypothetical protein [Candidatus Elulimicrobium humile]
MTKQNEKNTWTTDLPTFNWSNIADHPAPPAWHEMTAQTAQTDEWSLRDIDSSDWYCDPVEKQDEYQIEEDTTDYSSQEWKDGLASFKAMCEQHRNNKG